MHQNKQCEAPKIEKKSGEGHRAFSPDHSSNGEGKSPPIPYLHHSSRPTELLIRPRVASASSSW